jgi:vacuolar protein sorting-associated protein 13A/C
VPAAGRQHDQEDDEKRAQAAKRERLESAEQFASKTATHAPDDAAKNEGYLAALQNKILNNLQVTVENIHIRYEDDQSCPGHPLAAGVTLSSFTAKTTNEGWEILTKFPEKAPPTSHKVEHIWDRASAY